MKLAVKKDQEDVACSGKTDPALEPGYVVISPILILCLFKQVCLQYSSFIRELDMSLHTEMWRVQVVLRLNEDDEVKWSHFCLSLLIVEACKNGLYLYIGLKLVFVFRKESIDCQAVIPTIMHSCLTSQPFIHLALVTSLLCSLDTVTSLEISLYM